MQDELNETKRETKRQTNLLSVQKLSRISIHVAAEELPLRLNCGEPEEKRKLRAARARLLGE